LHIASLVYHKRFARYGLFGGNSSALPVLNCERSLMLLLPNTSWTEPYHQLFNYQLNCNVFNKSFYCHVCSWLMGWRAFLAYGFFSA